jgi:hypothetical protein
VHLLLFAATLLLDLTGTGHTDTVVLTQTQKQIEVTVRYGDRRRPTETFRFPVDTGLEDAVCAVPVYLKREKTHGFVIADNTCDSLHFSFNHKTNRMQYWRL